MEHLGGCSPTILALRAFRCAPLGAFSAIETMSDPCFISSIYVHSDGRQKVSAWGVFVACAGLSS